MALTELPPTATPNGKGPAHHRVVLVGAGFAGIGALHHLRRAGITDVALVERADRVGGVWRDNTYPGAACDVPSHLYSLSFAPNTQWARTFSRGPQIAEYLQDVAEREGVLDRVHFGQELLEARWDEAAQRWRLQCTSMELSCDVLVSCAGPLTEPVYPGVEGVHEFEGVTLHSSRWDHSQDLAGKRVAVVGTGASAIQIVPELQEVVEHLVVLQRTPGWVIPRMDRPVTRLERRITRRVPQLVSFWRGFQLAVRDGLHFPIIRRRPISHKVNQAAAKAFLRLQVRDPELRAKVTPNFELGCKRIMPTNRWLPALGKPNVTLVPSALARVERDAVVAADGSRHEVDAIVYATGFETIGSPIFSRVHAADGRSITDEWSGVPRYHRATTVAGFPNLFLICGPGTGLGHGSMVWQMESQMAYLVDALRVMDERGLGALEPRLDVQDAYMAWTGKQLEDTVWVKGGCKSWYLDASGKPNFLWPETMWGFKRMLERFDVEHYEARPAHAPAPGAGA